MNDQTITLAAICQVSQNVQQIAKTGTCCQTSFEMLLNSITITSPDNTLSVYGGDPALLAPGLAMIVKHLGDKSNTKDPSLTRYVVSLMALERTLKKKPSLMTELGKRIDDTQRQLAHYDINSDVLIASFASIYSDLISPLGTPIQVTGEPEVLKQSVNQDKIRALLLAGVRACVLWRQVGGKRRNIIFSRSKIVDCAQQLLKNI